MVKLNIIENTDRMIAGEKITNPGYKNLEIAKAISEQRTEKQFEKMGVLYNISKIIIRYYGKQDLAKQVLALQPLHYDETKLWWVWDGENFCWKLTDETDIINIVNHLADINSVNAKERNEIIEALRQEARLRKPKELMPSWIQFKDTFFDIWKGEEKKVTSDYFAVNPLPYSLHPDKFMNTPVMDKIFEEWVGKENVKTLYQIIAYCILPDYPLHRLFCLIGAGMNGKSCFLNLLRQFIGETNCTSTELDTLLNSRFEVTRLHKKLVCLMGETNFNELNRTSIIKKLTGGDLIGFEYKGKNPFHDRNYAKIIISTNNLPTTTDKSIGFYRRWLIIDFPNQFNEQKDILMDIPEEEYECLARKSCFILKDLLDERRFWNEGSVEDRMEKYEAKSNFLQKFIKESTIESVDGCITKGEFNKRFLDWCKENRHRTMSETTLGFEMKKNGIESGKKYFTWMNDGKGGDARVWFGLIWKE